MSTYRNVQSLEKHEAVASHCDIPPTPERIHIKEDRSISDVFSYLGELFGRLTSDLGELFSLHMDLLKAEVRDTAKTVARDSAMLIAAAVIGWFALGGITLALIAFISHLLPIEAVHLSLATGAAIVGVLYAIIAGGLAMAGIKHLQKANLAPDRTIQEIKRDKEAVKEL